MPFGMDENVRVSRMQTAILQPDLPNNINSVFLIFYKERVVKLSLLLFFVKKMIES